MMNYYVLYRMRKMIWVTGRIGEGLVSRRGGGRGTRFGATGKVGRLVLVCWVAWE